MKITNLRKVLREYINSGGSPEVYTDAKAELKQIMDNQGHYIKGGDGSHWEGCEETHWDCKIAKLEKENVQLRDKAQWVDQYQANAELAKKQRDNALAEIEQLRADNAKLREVLQMARNGLVWWKGWLRHDNSKRY